MPKLDSQVHAYERNHPGRPWVGTLYGPPEVTGDQMVAAMDAVGVDGAILVSPRRPRNLRCARAEAESGGASSQSTAK
jgi:predicted TIM-barrel fold metal-dependent hydrolase